MAKKLVDITKLLTVASFAEAIDRDRHCVYYRIKEGKIPAHAVHEIDGITFIDKSFISANQRSKAKRKK